MNDARRAFVTVLVSFPMALAASFALATAVVALLHPSAPTPHAPVAFDPPRAPSGLLRVDLSAVAPAAQLDRLTVETAANALPAQSASLASRPSAAGVDPLTASPAHGHVFVVEPLETQLGPGRFMSAPPSRVLQTGERLSSWPIYGSIVTAPE